MNKYKSNFKKNIKMMTVLILAIVIGLLLIGKIKENNSNNSINIGGSFSLIDQNNNKYDSSLIKKKKLIYFGYTFCPDVCPFDILKLSKFLDRYPDYFNIADFIFITVDPQRDTVKEVKSFLSNFNSSIIGLTGNQNEISKVIKKFRIFVKKNIGSNNTQNYLVDHSSLFFLLGKNDNYITHFSPSDFNSKIGNYF